MTLKLILLSVFLMVFVMLALGIGLLFNRTSGSEIAGCCNADNGSSCICAAGIDKPIK